MREGEIAQLVEQSLSVRGAMVQIPVDPTREIYLSLLPRVARSQYECGVLGRVANKYQA